jgi:hypothetical protein
LVIVRSAHNYSLEWEVHAVNFKTNAVRPRFATSPSGLLAKTLNFGGQVVKNMIEIFGAVLSPNHMEIPANQVDMPSVVEAPSGHPSIC